MIPAIRELDTFGRIAPFGVRFCDAATGAVVTDGLTVTLTRDPNSGTAALGARVNPSGVHVLHHAPGYIRFELFEGKPPSWESPAATPSDYMARVADSHRRFHAMRFGARLPHRGLFAYEDRSSSPARKLEPIPLYSTPWRSVPSGMASVRAELRTLGPQRPAAWALLVVEHGATELGLGLADSQGRVLVLFPYPEPVPGAVSSPSWGSPFSPRSLLEWPLTLRVHYDPALADKNEPDLDELLALRHGAPWQPVEPFSPLLPIGPDKTGPLTLGRQLVVRSAPDSPYLFISPA